MSLNQDRNMEELRKWRKKPLFGFYARPSRNRQGVRNMKKWECGIPGKAGLMWEGGLFKMMMVFPDEYPSKPPKCQFNPPLFHPNIFPSGTVCLSVLSVKEILLGVQELLDNPNPESLAQSNPYHRLKKDPERYRKKIRKDVRENPFNRD
ncbi:putative SUMO conjugating enzyme [Aspergillus japonicus CBS 114.51]|uniref:Ubiquitin-conjugating enzyme E2 2 n=1 Tax=Aspergillus japonicus CBS 114.51 TaxID=1448312 RepID=A0A8T8XEN7_ASPJA|nr:putative SUMO conjugating enzyme [Aspergillus japonicus CBS 114.51]RAH86763.1 putative SUMO conjugating enzyme [Aspergillus japonicus CBS 114.51]